MERIRDVLLWTSLALFIVSGAILIVSLDRQTEEITVPRVENTATEVPPTPSATTPSSTPLVTLTATSTLRPPPTFEPPTLTSQPSLTPTPTESPTFQLGLGLEGVHGLETATLSSTPGCQVRREWTLTYEVKPLDALERIAAQNGTTTWELAQANCLFDPDLIYIGQVLRVPGDTHPETQIECIPWEVHTPINWAFNIDGAGQLTFNWRGPRAPRNLIRVYNANGEIVFERTVDLRQNETIDLMETIPDEGIYTWYVYPLGMDFLQIDCVEGGPWTFHKNDGK